MRATPRTRSTPGSLGTDWPVSPGRPLPCRHLKTSAKAHIPVALSERLLAGERGGGVYRLAAELDASSAHPSRHRGTKDAFITDHAPAHLGRAQAPLVSTPQPVLGHRRAGGAYVSTGGESLCAGAWARPRSAAWGNWGRDSSRSGSVLVRNASR